MNIPGRRLSDVIGLLNLVVLHRTIAVLEGFAVRSACALGCLGGCRAGLISHSKKVQPSPPKRQRQETPQTQACNACDEFSCTCEHPGLVDASLNIFLFF